MLNTLMKCVKTTEQIRCFLRCFVLSETLMVYVDVCLSANHASVTVANSHPDFSIPILALS